MIADTGKNIQTTKVIVRPMDQKLRDLRTLKQHYYPEVKLLSLSPILRKDIYLRIKVEHSRVVGGG